MYGCLNQRDYYLPPPYFQGGMTTAGVVNLGTLRVNYTDKVLT